MTSFYTDPLLPKERNLKRSPIIKDGGTSCYTINHPINHTLENPETMSTITTEIVIPRPDQETKISNQIPHQKQNPTKTKGNNKQNQAQKTKLTNKSITHQLLSNHYAKFPHYEKPLQTPDHYLAQGLISLYYHHQQLNALALLHLRRNNLRLHPLTWQQQLQLQQQRYNHLFKPRQLEPLQLLPLQQIREYMIDFEQLCEGMQEEDHQEEERQEVEAQDQSPPLLPKALYRQLPPET